jgi:hypothetical protein
VSTGWLCATPATGPSRVVLTRGEPHLSGPMAKSDTLKRRELSESLKSSKPANGAASQKCSFTLYQTDLDVLDEIRKYLRRHGVRNLSDSEALRLACRTVSFDDCLLKTYAAMRLEDGRRRH